MMAVTVDTGGCRCFAMAVLGAIAFVGIATPASAGGRTERVSVGAGGVQANRGSFEPSMSAGGRFVGFASVATNLIPGGTNGYEAVFVRDRVSGTTELMVVGPNGAQGNGASSSPSVSADGRFVAFESYASNLVDRDTNGDADVFVHDRKTGKTELVSVGPKGVQGNSLSDLPRMSADGRFIGFVSAASNFVPNDTNGWADAFIRDRQLGTTERVSLGRNGVQGNGATLLSGISSDGRFVVFDSEASNLVPNDNNRVTDVFVRDRKTSKTECVSITTSGRSGNGQSYYSGISADGRYVVFVSGATNLVSGDSNRNEDIFIRDRQSRTTHRVSVGLGGVQSNGWSFSPAVSANGRFIAFVSAATNLVAGDTNRKADTFIYDQQAHTTQRVSFGPRGGEGNGDSLGVLGVSERGGFIAFSSQADNLVAHDTNGDVDVFVWRRD